MTMTEDTLEGFLNSLREQIARGETELALDRLHNYVRVAPPEIQEEVTLLSARYYRLQRDSRRGVVARDRAEAEENRIVAAFLDLLAEIPRRVDADKKPVPAPVLPTERVAIPAEAGLEKIIGINNLKQISWIAQGLQVSESVCRVLTPNGLGTGFLIGQDVMMTNHHVIPDKATAARSVVEFNYQQDFAGNPRSTCRYSLDARRFRSSPRLDVTMVGVRLDPEKPGLERWGHVLLNANADPVPGEHVIIVQHPNGGLKQIVLTANQVVNLWEHRLHYTTDTMPGSSGAPVFNDAWQVIAIHHAGGNRQMNAQGDRRFVNEGILMSAIRSEAGDFWPV